MSDTAHSSSAIAGRLPQLWRWRFGCAGPAVELTATVGEAARAMAMRAALSLYGSARLDRCLHGPEDVSSPDGRHLHAKWMPEDLDGDGKLDHLSVFVAGGASRHSRQVLDSCRNLRIDGFRSKPLFPCMGVQQTATASRVWQSVTPFVGERFAKKGAKRPIRQGLSAREQLIVELNRHRQVDGQPLPASAVIEDERVETASADKFNLGGRARQGAELRARGWFVIVFASPVQGPLSFGLGSHFGLGRFTVLRPEPVR